MKKPDKIYTEVNIGMNNQNVCLLILVKDNKEHQYYAEYDRTSEDVWNKQQEAFERCYATARNRGWDVS